MELKNNNQEIESKIWLTGVESIERNFAGLEFNDHEKTTSVGIVKKLYRRYYSICDINNNYDVIKRIKENRNEPNSRYLLLISKSSISCHLLSYILENTNYNFFIGSRFKKDLKSEEYQFKIINKIQLFMEQGGTIILKDLESVYPALYDLFNQNFTVTSNRNYARITIGKTVNSYCYVNEKFKCIVDLDIDKITKQDPPFLNRFEKHIITFEFLLGNNELINCLNVLFVNITFPKLGKSFKILVYILFVSFKILCL